MASVSAVVFAPAPTVKVPALVTPDWLAQHLDTPGIVILDVTVGTIPLAATQIPGARQFDLDTEMSDLSAKSPHTLPTPEAFTAACQRLGICEDSHVIVYDSNGVYSSPRARFMLVTAGHRKVSVLDGGLPAWEAAGLPTEARGTESSGRRGTFVAGTFLAATVDRYQVEQILAKGNAAVLDARSSGRFYGRAPEPRAGVRSGHMPGAVSLPFEDLLDHGSMRPVAELDRILDEAAPDHQPIVATCGSGVTACVTGLAAELTGREYRVYDGSWGEWGAPDGGVVVTGA